MLPPLSVTTHVVSAYHHFLCFYVLFFQIVRSYKLSDATAFLLEKAGDIHGAFGILQESLLTKIKALMEVVEIGVDNYDQNGE